MREGFRTVCSRYHPSKPSRREGQSWPSVPYWEYKGWAVQSETVVQKKIKNGRDATLFPPRTNIYTQTRHVTVRRGARPSEWKGGVKISTAYRLPPAQPRNVRAGVGRGVGFGRLIKLSQLVGIQGHSLGATPHVPRY